MKEDGTGSGGSDPAETAPVAENRTCMGPLDFSTFLLSLGSSAMVNLGMVAAPDAKEPTRDLAAAKQIIDILGILEEKTRGNRTEPEDKLINSLLYDLRVHFVDAEGAEKNAKPDK